MRKYSLIYSTTMINSRVQWVVFYICFSGFIFLVDGYTDGTTVAPPDGSYCTAYCYRNTDFKSGFNCDNSTVQYFCCGEQTYKYCCNDPSRKIQDEFNGEDQYVCENWWPFNWQMALGMLGTVILLLTISACCCQCIAHRTNTRAVARAEAATSNSRRRAESDVATIEMEEQTRREQPFNPESPFAFVPPDYAKDPPKYQDIYENSLEGISNLAFSNEDDTTNIVIPSMSTADPQHGERENTPPPPYTLHNESGHLSSDETNRDHTTSYDEINTEIQSAEEITTSPILIRVSNSPTTIDNTGEESEKEQ